MEILESLHLMVLDPFGLESWELRIIQKVLKVAELVFGLLSFIVVLFLVFNDGHFLIVVSIQEWINSSKEREMKELRKLQHHDFCVRDVVFVEQVGQKHLN